MCERKARRVKLPWESGAPGTIVRALWWKSRTGAIPPHVSLQALSHHGLHLGIAMEDPKRCTARAGGRRNKRALQDTSMGRVTQLSGAR